MKLKEKLAKTFAETETYTNAWFTAENAYLAGFDKARDMAASLILDKGIRETMKAWFTEYEGKMTEPFQKYASSIMELGEEEVG